MSIPLTRMACRKMSVVPTISDHSIKTALAPYLNNPHPKNNVPEGIYAKLDKRLHLKQHHPLNIIKTKYV
jgi:hypothetical protein